MFFIPFVHGGKITEGMRRQNSPKQKDFFSFVATKNWTKLFLTAPKAKHFFCLEQNQNISDVTLLIYFLIEAHC